MDPRFISSSTWMRDTLHLIGHKSFVELVLPGTHDSAAYEFTDKYMPGAQPKNVQRIIKLTDFIIGSFIKNIEITQELTIYQQLKRGARYLDIRAGWLDNKWYTYHCHAGPTLENVLNQTKKFLLRHECEVVILEISHFRNKTKENEILLKRLIVQCLGDMLCDKDPMSKFCLLDIISRNKRAVVIMPKVTDPELGLWPDKIVRNSYPEKNEVPKVRAYNEIRIKDNPKEKLLKISWILTPEASDLNKDLLKLAKQVNTEMAKSFYKLKLRKRNQEKEVEQGGKEFVSEEKKIVNEDARIVIKEKEVVDEEKGILIEEEKKEIDEGIEEKKENLEFSESSESEDNPEEEHKIEVKVENTEELQKPEVALEDAFKQLSINPPLQEPSRDRSLEGIILLVDNLGKSNIMNIIYELNHLIPS